MVALGNLAAAAWVVSALGPYAVAQQYRVPAGFPASLFSSYYVSPAPTVEPQPIVHDTILNYTYPLNLTSPTTIPETDPDPVYYPTPIGNFTNGTAIVNTALAQIRTIIASNTTGSTNCTRCISALQVGQYVAQRVPRLVPDAMLTLCETTGLFSNATCKENYEAGSFGAIWTQILALANVTGLDGQYICRSLSSTFCPLPYTRPSNVTGLWKPKPANATAPPPSGKRVKVMHLSDLHIDPRYAVGREANCTSGLCCRVPETPTNASIRLPAPLYGAYKCDSPYYLITAALESIAPLTNTTHVNNVSETDQFAWTVYTGDLVSHDPQNQLSRNYTQYAEYVLYTFLKKFLPSGPIFPVLGNHDSNPEAIDAPHSLPGVLGQQQSWNYDHVASLWQHNGWITAEYAAQARMHYAAYSITHPKYSKLRIITLNTDFWYRSNFLNYINTTNPDNSGGIAFLIQELQKAEDAGQRVWIIGHVLTGWDGTNPLPQPTDLFYQVIGRYAPHVIANIFFGHTHEDQFMLYYSNNGTVQDEAHAQATGWIGPSVVPLTNLNSGYRMYVVDTGDFNIYDAYTYYSDVNTYSSIDPTNAGPTFQLEYSTREAYPIDWPATAPLNATYWHRVTEAMLANHTLVTKFNTYEGKSSILSPNCTSNACAQAKVCYMRSGSVALGQQCPQGFASVQSAYTGKNF